MDTLYINWKRNRIKEGLYQTPKLRTPPYLQNIRFYLNSIRNKRKSVFMTSISIIFSNLYIHMCQLEYMIAQIQIESLSSFMLLYQIFEPLIEDKIW